MEFLVIPAKGDVRNLLGLGLEERGTKMLAAAGLQAASGIFGDGPLVLYPGERVGPGALGKEIAAINVAGPEVFAAIGLLAGDTSGDGIGRPVLLVGAQKRAALLAGILTPDDAYRLAASGVTDTRTLQTPTILVTDQASRDYARSMLLKALRKPIDGLVSRTLNRPVSIAVSSIIVATPLTPNHLSVICFLLALGAAGLMVSGHFVLGAVLMHVSSVLDGCDGEVARLKYQSSKLGGWLDTVFDDISNNVFALSTGIGLYLIRGGDWFGTLLLILAAIGFVMAVPVAYATYRRMIQTGHSDSGAIDWSGGRQASGWRRFFTTWLAPLVKRDAYLFAFLLMAIAQVPEAIVVFYAIGSVGAVGTMLTDPG
jgi:phosphatidylglycerophosphate synthase